MLTFCKTRGNGKEVMHKAKTNAAGKREVQVALMHEFSKSKGPAASQRGMKSEERGIEWHTLRLFRITIYGLRAGKSAWTRPSRSNHPRTRNHNLPGIRSLHTE